MNDTHADLENGPDVVSDEQSYHDDHTTTSLDVREELLNLIDNAESGGVWDAVVVEPNWRNSFCMRMREHDPIFTVTITYGGALRVQS